MKQLKYLFWLCIGSIILAGCATQQVEPQRCANVELNDKIKSGAYVQKIDNFLIVLDESSSMFVNYKGRMKADLAEELVGNMALLIPDIKLKGAVRIFGPQSHPVTEGSKPLWGLTDYSGTEMMRAIDGLAGPQGGTPMARAIRRAKDDLANTTGNMALIIISDGEDISLDKKIEAARSVKERFGDRICIYTIHIGKDPKGKALMKSIANEGGCGYATTYDEVSSVVGCTTFVKDVFLKRADKPATTATIIDSDGDGVPDNRDKCPNTPKGVAVDANGCPKPPKPGKAITVKLNVEFDFDKYYIRPAYYGQLENFANYLQQYPGIQVEIAGHTDNYGAEAYNQELSTNRANAIKTYLLSNHQIESARLVSKGYGTKKPLTNNKTDDGRQRNRRVEAVLSTR